MFELLANPYFLLIIGAVVLVLFCWRVLRQRGVNIAHNTHNMSDMTALAYTRIVENMDDGVFVLDADNRIVTVNKAALTMVDSMTLETVGQPVDRVFANMPDVLARYRDTPQAKAVLSDVQSDGLHYYVLDISPLFANGKDLTGRVIVIQDETARIAAQDQVRKLSQAVAFSGSIVFMTDIDGHIEYVNPAFTAVTGYSLNEVLGRTPRLLQSGESPPEVYADLWQCLEAGREWRGEFHNRKKNGELYWVQSTVSPVLDDTGTPTNYIAIQEDVTEQKRMAEEEHRQRILAEALRDNAAMINSTLNLKEVLDRVLDNIQRVLDVPHDLISILLIDEQHIASVVVFRAMGDAAVDEVAMDTLRMPVQNARNLREAISTSDPVIIPDVREYEGWIDTGTLPAIRSALTIPIRLEKYIIGFLHLGAAVPNIFTAEHGTTLQPFADQAAIAIRNARMFGSSQIQVHKMGLLNQLTTASLGTLDMAALLAEFVEVTAAITGAKGCAIMLWDDEARRVSDPVTSRHCKVHWQDAPQVELVGFTVDMLHSEQSLNVVDSSKIAADYPQLAGLMQGCKFWVLPLQAAGQALGMLVLSFTGEYDPNSADMLWAQQSAELIALAISQTQGFAALKDRNRELDAFSHTVAHDLRAPLSLVIGYLALLESEQDTTDELANFIREALHAAERMNDMIEGLLLLSQIRSSADVLGIRVPVDINASVEAAMGRFRMTIRMRGVQINVQPDMPPVLAYSPWVEEVLANLISNAIKYIGQDNENPQISIQAVRQGAEVRCTVTDNGVGISSEDQVQLFEMFSRFHKTEAGGLGLGLSIVQRIITRLDGNIGVESVPGEGSTFWFTLPVAEDD